MRIWQIYKYQDKNEKKNSLNYRSHTTTTSQILSYPSLKTGWICGLHCNNALLKNIKSYCSHLHYLCLIFDYVFIIRYFLNCSITDASYMQDSFQSWTYGPEYWQVADVVVFQLSLMNSWWWLAMPILLLLCNSAAHWGYRRTRTTAP